MNTAPRKRAEIGLFKEVWKETNRILDYLREISPTTGRGVKITRTLNNTLVSSDVEIASASSLKQYRLKEIGADWLRCREYNGTTESDSDVYIAREFEFRRSKWEGQSIDYNLDGDPFTATYTYSSNTKRVKTIGGVAETQFISPLYKLDFTVIIAAQLKNITGVTSPSGSQISIVEITNRAWTKS